MDTPTPLRECQACHKELSIKDNFYEHRRRGGATTIDTRCKNCRQKRGKQRYVEDPAYREKRLQNNKEYGQTPMGRYTTLKVSARRRNIECPLTQEQFISIFSLPCHYCHDMLGVRSHTSGLDRKDNTRGYDIDNVLPCCAICNYLRNNIMTVEETEYIVSCLLQFRTKNQ